MKQLNLLRDDSETLFIGINLGLKKWLIVGTYKRQDQKKFFREFIFKNLDISRHILLGDLNMTHGEKTCIF